MKLPAYDHKNALFDQFDQFYNVYGGYRGGYAALFWRFDNGSMIVKTGKWEPSDRKVYRDYGVTIAATIDNHCPTLRTPEGRKVTKAELNEGGYELLLIDHASRRAVSLGYACVRDNWQQQIPANVRGCGAYFASDDSLPMGYPVELMVHPTLTMEEQETKQMLLDTCRAWLALEKSEGNTAGAATHPTSIGLCLSNYSSKTTFADLQPIDRIRLATNGWYNSRIPEIHPYLMADM